MISQPLPFLFICQVSVSIAFWQLGFETFNNFIIEECPNTSKPFDSRGIRAERLNLHWTNSSSLSQCVACLSPCALALYWRERSISRNRRSRRRPSFDDTWTTRTVDFSIRFMISPTKIFDRRRDHSFYMLPAT